MNAMTFEMSPQAEEFFRPPSDIELAERAALEREGAVWTVEFGGVVRHLQELKGLVYLSRLLRQPGEPIAAVDLEEPRAAGGRSSEQARLNVTRAIRSVMTRLDDVHPALAEHLKATVRTGTKCSYRPDPRVPIRWRTDPR
jgi:hypothetical protein